MSLRVPVGRGGGRWRFLAGGGLLPEREERGKVLVHLLAGLNT